MEFTLDSVRQTVEALKLEHKGKEVSFFPIITTDLKALETTVTNKYYFGLVSIGSNVSYAKFFNGIKDVLRIDANSQGIEFFSSLTCYDGGGVALPIPLGQFRGFEIYIR